MQVPKKKWEDGVADTLRDRYGWDRTTGLNTAQSIIGIEGKENEYIPYYAAALELKRRLTKKKIKIPKTSKIRKAQEKDEFSSPSNLQKMIKEISEALERPVRMSEAQKIREYFEIASYFIKINDHIQGEEEFAKVKVEAEVPEISEEEELSEAEE